MTEDPSSELKLNVPKGFFDVMEVFVRSMLQDKPTDVFEYGAAFFETLLHIRTNTGHDPAVHGPKSEDGFYNVHFKANVDKKKAAKKER